MLQAIKTKVRAAQTMRRFYSCSVSLWLFHLHREIVQQIYIERGRGKWQQSELENKCKSTVKCKQQFAKKPEIIRHSRGWFAIFVSFVDLVVVVVAVNRGGMALKWEAKLHIATFTYVCSVHMNWWPMHTWIWQTTLCCVCVYLIQNHHFMWHTEKTHRRSFVIAVAAATVSLLL